jgi:hypothetical protein
VSTTDGSLEGEGEHGPGRVGADAGQGHERVELAGQRAAVPVDHRPGAAVQVDGPPVVAQPGPQADHLARLGRGACGGAGEAVEEGVVAGDDPVDARLLRHHLGHEHRPGVAGGAPRQRP